MNQLSEREKSLYVFDSLFFPLKARREIEKNLHVFLNFGKKEKIIPSKDGRDDFQNGVEGKGQDKENDKVSNRGENLAK